MWLLKKPLHPFSLSNIAMNSLQKQQDSHGLLWNIIPRVEICPLRKWGFEYETKEVNSGELQRL